MSYKTHGKTFTQEYSIWLGIKQRCFNKNSIGFHNYGGRGITMCSEWRNSFEAFYKHMGDRPVGKSIDRINNHGNYEPGNCRWATQAEQVNNSRMNVLSFSAFGEYKKIGDWMRDSRCLIKSRRTLRKRVLSGVPGEMALTAPLRKNNQPWGFK
jgi:hypothetical protein